MPCVSISMMEIISWVKMLEVTSLLRLGLCTKQEIQNILNAYAAYWSSRETSLISLTTQSTLHKYSFRLSIGRAVMEWPGESADYQKLSIVTHACNQDLVSCNYTASSYVKLPFRREIFLLQEPNHGGYTQNGLFIRPGRNNISSYGLNTCCLNTVQTHK